MQYSSTNHLLSVCRNRRDPSDWVVDFIEFPFLEHVCVVNREEQLVFNRKKPIWQSSSIWATTCHDQLKIGRIEDTQIKYKRTETGLPSMRTQRISPQMKWQQLLSSWFCSEKTQLNSETSSQELCFLTETETNPMSAVATIMALCKSTYCM